MKRASKNLVNDRDAHLLANFEKGIAPPDGFHHRDHVLVAFLYLQKYPATEALARFAAALQNFARANGKPQLYHETITWAYIALIHQRMTLELISEKSASPAQASTVSEKSQANAAASGNSESDTSDPTAHSINSLNWENFSAHNPDLFEPKNAAIARLYRPETLNSALAKKVFVLPDLPPTPHQPR
jgi:hypothetical protein